MQTRFSGFPKEMFTFLEELRANNNKAWFHENKPRYETFVVKPVTHFIEEVGAFLPLISDSFLADTRRNGGSMFRIYRDTRFSKDKRPYKENVGCQFRHTAGKDAHAPGFYVHLSPHEVFIGGGIWLPPTATLSKIRDAIVESPQRWSQVTNDPTINSYFGGVTGDGLKRPPRGYPADHPHIDDLKRKSLILFKEIPPEQALTPDFIDEVEHAFTTAAPLMAFLTRALGLPF